MQVARVAPDWLVPSLMHRRRVLGDCIPYIGLDVHNDGIAVAVAEGGLRGHLGAPQRLRPVHIGVKSRTFDPIANETRILPP